MSNKSYLFQILQQSLIKRTFCTTSKTKSPTQLTEKVKLRIAAAAIVERVPVILPEIPQFEVDYLKFVERRNEVYSKEQTIAAQKRVDEE